MKKSTNSLLAIQTAVNKHLDAGKRDRFKQLEKKLTTRWTNYKLSRDELASTLYELRTLLAKDKLFSRVLDAYGIARQTAYDMADDYKRIHELPAAVRTVAVETHFNLTAKRLEPVLAKYEKELSKATTKKAATKMLEKIKLEGKRKPKVITMPEHREERYVILKSQVSAYFGPLRNKSGYQQSVETLFQELVDDLLPGFTVVLQDKKPAAAVRNRA